MTKFKRKLRNSVIAVALALSGTMNANADIGTAMNDMFNTMSNYTQPGVFETQRRGVISGGSIVARNPIVSTDIISMQLPSFRAGCSGIDFFGGSFSFINADQFVQLMRAVAANAVGYAFQLALQTSCSGCMNVISKLQTIIQDLNSSFGNSCRLAQGIVTDTASALGMSVDTKSSLSSTLSGLASDIGEAFTASKGETPVEQQKSLPKAEQDKIMGNILWQQLNKNDINRLIYTSSGNAYREYEEMMSVTGSIIIGKAEDDGEGEVANKVTTLLPKLSLKDLVEGAEDKEIYVCDDNDCTSPRTQRRDIPSLYQRIYEVIVGTNGAGDGVIYKFARYNNNAFDQAEANVMSNLPAEATMMIRNMVIGTHGRIDESMARSIAYAAALEWAKDYLIDITKLIKEAATGSNSDSKEKVIKLINEAQARIYADYTMIAEAHPTVSQISQQYGDLMRIVKLPSLQVNVAAGPESKPNN